MQKESGLKRGIKTLMTRRGLDVVMEGIKVLAIRREWTTIQIRLGSKEERKRLLEAMKKAGRIMTQSFDEDES